MTEPLHVLERGAGAPLVMIHGDFFDGPTTWAAQLEPLAAHHRLIVPDRRGRGASPLEPRPYTIDRDAEDVLAVLDREGRVERFHLLGQSYGAVVALEVARRVPERILSLHLIEPPYLALFPGDPTVADLTARSRAAFALAGEDPEAAVVAFATMLAGPEAAERLRTRPVFGAMVREAGALAHVQHPADYPAERLAGLRLRVPVRIYTGGRSHPGFHRVAAVLAAALPTAEIVAIPDATHDVQRSPAFNTALLAVTDPS